MTASLLLLAACADPVDPPATTPTDPVGTTWTVTGPPAPPPATVAGPREGGPTPRPLRLRDAGEARLLGTPGAGEGEPALAAHPDGGFLLSYSQGARPCTAFAERLDAAGAPVDGTRLPVAREPACDPVAAVDAAGRLIVVSDPDTRDAISLQRVDPATGVERVFDVTTGGKGAGANLPAVTATADGGVAVTWTAPLPAGGAAVWARTYDALLVPRSAELPVTVGTGPYVASAVAPLGADVTLAWTEVSALGEGELWLGRWDGVNPLFAWALAVTTPDGGLAEDPAVAVTADGRVVVAWQRTEVDGRPRIAVGVHGPDGARALPPTTISDGRSPAIALLDPDALAVAWLTGDVVSLVVLRVSDGAVLVPALALSDPGVDATDPVVAVVVDGEVARLGAAWAQRDGLSPSEVHGRVVTFDLPRPPAAR